MTWLDSSIEWLGIVLLFCLVFGMSATVDIEALKQQLCNKEAIVSGLFLQFGIVPLLGFAVVKILKLDHATGVTLLVVSSSPGGSYSNWWCSMFNADLALSVAMTAISTLASSILMPLNLYWYVKFSYDEDILATIKWQSLIFALLVVIVAIGLGLYASAKVHTANFNLRMNQLGNFAGLSLVLFSAIMSNAHSEARFYNREWQFYVGVAVPCILGLLIANVITTALHLNKPERVTVSIECCYQNVGIATSVALAMFNGYDQAKAVAVPFYYGMLEAGVLLVYCLVAWKAGWTKSPKDDSFWNMISTSYEVMDTLHRKEGDGLVDDEDEDHSKVVDVRAETAVVTNISDYQAYQDESEKEQSQPKPEKVV